MDPMDTHGTDCIHGDDAMMDEFLHLALRLNEELGIAPLLFGSLGLGLRLGMDLEAHDIDVLVPEHYLGDGWDELITIMQDDGYVLYDLHEHAFRRHGASVAFASLESLAPFAGVDVDAIPVIGHGAIRYRLLELPDYLKVYSASLLDGYRRKRKDDRHKIDLINRALRQGG